MFPVRFGMSGNPENKKIELTKLKKDSVYNFCLFFYNFFSNFKIKNIENSAAVIVSEERQKA